MYYYIILYPGVEFSSAKFHYEARDTKSRSSSQPWIQRKIFPVFEEFPEIRDPENRERERDQLENHRKTVGKWWFNGIVWDLPSGN